MSHTIGDLIDDVLEALAALAGIGEEIDEEWSYVTDLEAAWRSRLEAVAADRADEEAAPPIVRAIVAAIDETRRIRDPNRAIDWLSTFPQVVLVAMDETR